jgi:hypothetical protein
VDKENNIVYIETKNGIFKCFKSEQMHKSIYYPAESKTNGYIDYNEVISILTIDDLYKQVKKQKEVIDDYKEDISNLFDIINKNCNDLKCTSDEWLVIQKYQDKEVSE